MSKFLDRFRYFKQKGETFADGHGQLLRPTVTGRMDIASVGSMTKSSALPTGDLHWLLQLENLRQKGVGHLGNPADSLSAYPSAFAETTTLRLPARCQRLLAFLQCQPPEIPDDAQRLMKMWREAKALHSYPVEAWASIIEDADKAKALSRRVDAWICSSSCRR
ncbi:hypothetical protein ACLK19_08325 [Escherichia coli]